MMGDSRSKEDYVHQISTSIYVTNFPEHFSSRDLWKKCQEYGRVIDAYILNRRTKSSDSFGFVRFIHIKDVDRLVKNLCTLWMGRLRLHANVARFQRPPLNKTQPVKGANVGYKYYVGVPSNNRVFSMGQSSYLGAVKNNREHKQVAEMDSKPSLGLDESCILEYNYSLVLKGKVSDFGLLTNLKIVLTNEIHAKEVSGWIPDFLEEDAEDDESGDDKLDNESDGEKIEEDLQAHSINELKKPNNDNKEEGSFKATLKYLPGFTLDDMLRIKDVQDVVEEVEVHVLKQKSNVQVNSTKDNSFKGVTHSKEEDKESYCSGHFRSLEGIMGFSPNITSITLDRYLSDHRPIILRGVCYDYGPVLFRMFHYWFEWDGFDRFIKHTWSNSNISDNNVISKLMKKLRHLKVQTRLSVDQELLNKRVNVMNSLHDLEKLKATEIAQKVKINWSIEGDENSKFFHGMLNKKRNQHDICGILSKGNWIEDPNSVKNEFLSHFKERIDSRFSSILMLDGEFPNKQSADQNLDLERNVTNEEIKRAVWDCGTDKSPGPDGFTFGFYRRYWDTIKKDVVKAVSFFFTSGTFPKGDVLIHWCDSKKKETMIFKVDFEKAYDSVRWDYLDDVLNKFGFGLKRRNWIHNCLNSSKGSILVNGSPTSRIKAWDDNVVKLHARLSKWKMKTLSIGGRLALLKSVLGSTPIYYMSIYKVLSKVLKCLEDIRRNFFIGADLKEKKRSWFKWNRVLASKDKGGLGVSSFFALNRALLFKWMRRFHNDRNAIWSRFIRAVHSNSGGIEMRSRVSYSSTWLTIVNEVNNLRNKGIDLLSYMKIKVGNGLNTKFWDNVWMGNKNFKTSFPRIYAFESDKKHTLASKMIHNDVGFSLRRQSRDGVEMEQSRR
nr:RNA-directed DNA polymerase, eukaryota [Tanacetum cinerariifolium]